MKKSFITVLALASLLFATSCGYKRIGDLTMVSTRNVDSNVEHVELRRYVVAKVKTKKHDPLEQAIDNAVKEVPGGEYMKNVKVYIKDSKKIKVEGDVWGVAGKEVQLKESQQKKLDKQKRDAEFEKQKQEIKGN